MLLRSFSQSSRTLFGNTHKISPKCWLNKQAQGVNAQFLCWCVAWHCKVMWLRGVVIRQCNLIVGACACHAYAPVIKLFYCHMTHTIVHRCRMAIGVITHQYKYWCVGKFDSLCRGLTEANNSVKYWLNIDSISFLFCAIRYCCRITSETFDCNMSTTTNYTQHRCITKIVEKNL